MGSPSLKIYSLFLLAILISCERPKAVEKVECVDRDANTGMPIAARQTFQSGLVNYRGVSFTFSPSIQAEVVAETRCAVPFDEQKSTCLPRWLDVNLIRGRHADLPCPIRPVASTTPYAHRAF
jgi:hypothetical protein